MPQRPPKIHYAFVTDANTQWFSYILAYTEIAPVEECSSITVKCLSSDEVPSRLSCEFLTDVLSRKAELNLRVNIQGSDWFYGSSLSPMEYVRLKKMLKLFPAHEEYLRLGKCYE